MAVVYATHGGQSHTPTPGAILPGSFNPLHAGHLQLATTACQRLGHTVHFELSITNVDKPDLTDDVIRHRAAQFDSVGQLWLTRAARFSEKAELFPGAWFVVGYDTAVRMLDPRYSGTAEARDAGLARLWDLGCRVLVGGRVDATGIFRTWKEQAEQLSRQQAMLFEELPEEMFRVDLSSTALRASSAS
jgi:hypothetical protein